MLAYKYPQGDSRTETDFWNAATKLRDTLQPKIRNYAELFEPVH